MDFREKLARLMRARGFTQTCLGGKLGVSQRAVGKWLAGDSSPSPQIAKKLADEFGLSVEVLMEAAHDLPPIALLGPRTQVVFREIEPGTKWGELPRDLRARLAAAAFADNPQVRSLLAEFVRLAPAIERALEIIRTLQHQPPAGKIISPGKTAGLFQLPKIE